MRVLLISILVIILLSCERKEEEFCLTCTELFYVTEPEYCECGGWFYNDTFLREKTSIECSSIYRGPYTIHGRADNPENEQDFYWSYKECVDQ